MNDQCSCGEKFRGAEDFRDHLPCPSSRAQSLSDEVAAARKDWEMDGDWEGKSLSDCCDTVWNHGYMTAANELWALLKHQYHPPTKDGEYGYYESRKSAQDKFIIHYHELEKKAVEFNEVVRQRDLLSKELDKEVELRHQMEDKMKRLEQLEKDWQEYKL